jgi:hypothetical protein
VLPAELAEQLRRYAHDASGIAGPVDTQAWTALKVALQRATATRPAVPAVEVVGDAQGDGGGNSGDDEKQSGGKQVEAAQGGGAAEVGAEQATFRLLGVFSGGISDDRIAKAAGILHSKKMVANEKLTSINAILPFPPTASAKQLADLLGVTKTAIQKTAWWIENRKGERDNLIGRRHAKHQERAKEYEADNRD